MPSNSTAQLLSGLRVVEASAFVAAPLGGMTLAQMGADVIRIDPPGGGLDYRRWPVTANNTSLFWAGLNKSKRSVVIDLTKPEGRELAMALICAPGDDAGFLLTNFPARGVFSFEGLSAQRSDLIQLTITGDRHGGSAVDYTVNPRMGLPYLTGQGAQDHAVNHLLPAWDLITGNMAVTSLLAAERHRRRSGQGQHIRLALEDVALAAMGHLGFLAEAQLGVERERVGNDLYGAFGRDFLTQDEQRVMVVGLTPKQWRGLVQATQSQQEIAQISARLGVDLDAEGARFQARDAIAQVVGAWIAARPLAEVASTFDAHAVCWGRYQSVKQLVQNDEACSLSNAMFSKVAQAGAGTYFAPGLPMEFSAFERQAAAPAPRLGEHTEAVLQEVLGLNSAQLGELVRQHIIEVV